MPGAVAKAGLADKILLLGQIGSEITRIVWQSRSVNLATREASSAEPLLTPHLRNSVSNNMPSDHTTSFEFVRTLVRKRSGNRINQIYITELLKYCGCTSELADNGDAALTALQNQRFDLVLMDCQMPEMDGFTATREIRRREADGEKPTANSPVTC